nr:helix-turn-helix transcriptional regulator [Mucispirillum schaedleri]
MAIAFNTNKQTISDYERGRTSPKLDFLKKLVSDYNVNLNYLIANQGNMLLSNADKTSLYDVIGQLQLQTLEQQDRIKELQAQVDLLKELLQSNNKQS